MIGTARTVVAILELAQPKESDTVVITGAAGGVGTLVVEAALSTGASVVGLVSNEDKAHVVRDLGATAVNYTSPDRVHALRDELAAGTASLLLDGVGGELGTKLLDVAGVGGRLVMFGTAAGTYLDLTTEDIFRRGITVTAAVGARLLDRPGGLRPLEERALEMLEAGGLQPVIQYALPLYDGAVAHSLVEARTTIGKLVLAP